MTKQYKGRTATIEIDEKNIIIKSSGFFSSSKKTIPLRDIKNVELSASSFFSKDTVEIYYGSNVEKVQFSNSADAKNAATDITDIARKNRRTSPLGELTGLATSLFGIGVSVASAIKEDQERQRKREIQKAEAEYKKAVDDFLNSGKLTTTTPKQWGISISTEISTPKNLLTRYTKDKQSICSLIELVLRIWFIRFLEILHLTFLHVLTRNGICLYRNI